MPRGKDWLLRVAQSTAAVTMLALVCLAPKAAAATPGAAAAEGALDNVQYPAPGRDPDPACFQGICSDDPEPARVGHGYHPFGHGYALLGFNSMWPCGSTVFELESSLTYVTQQLIWFGPWASAGFRSFRDTTLPCAKLTELSASEDEAVRFERAAGRLGGGLELGWRVFGVDLGYIQDRGIDDVIDNGGHGLRFRAGVALSYELFTSGFARYRRSCCKPAKANAVPCECERTPVGVSVFAYYAHEAFFSHDDWNDNMFGISLKIGVGL